MEEEKHEVEMPPVLYHYCPTEAFHAIVESKSIWLSSLSLSNDKMEGGKIIANIISYFSDKEQLDEYARLHLEYTFLSCERRMDGLGFCLSARSDLLSQWRGYTGDATGVSIGFSTKFLKCISTPTGNSRGEVTGNTKGLNLSLQKVEYEPDVHKSLAEPIYHKMMEKIALRAPEIPLVKDHMVTLPQNYSQQRDKDQIMIAKFAMEVPELYAELFRCKSPAFREEREWRLLSFPNQRPQTVLHRATRNCIIPYLKVDLTGLHDSPIVEVILGPKHDTPINVVEKFLQQHGYTALVKPSAASYR